MKIFTFLNLTVSGILLSINGSIWFDKTCYTHFFSSFSMITLFDTCQRWELLGKKIGNSELTLNNCYNTFISIFPEKIVRAFIKCVSFKHFSTFYPLSVLFTEIIHHILNLNILCILFCENKEQWRNAYCHHNILDLLLLSHVSYRSSCDLFHPFLQFFMLDLLSVIFFCAFLMIKYSIFCTL